MSTGDPFADDPFADPPADEAAAPEPQPEATAPEPTPEPEAPEPQPEAPEPTAEDLEPHDAIPVVDREGQEVAAEPVAEAPPEPQEPAQETPEAAEAPETPPEPPAAPSAPPAPPADPAASANGTGAPETVPPPGPNDPKKGHRLYVILVQTGPVEFELVNLQKRGKEDTSIRPYIKRTVEPGAKEGDPDVVNFYLEARNNEHAYRLAFAIMGRPEGGTTVLPLPKASWRPRRVAPAPPQPERERLTIS